MNETLKETFNELNHMYSVATCHRLKTDLYFMLGEILKSMELQRAMHKDIGVDYV